ncbi:hypothetical protein N431DRAFT_205399 [Stipitochalara longipes BDJ]|nr:hypothetical protein N431DRAFT_205399 [Stipitochalara longipes BDJ]
MLCSEKRRSRPKFPALRPARVFALTLVVITPVFNSTSSKATTPGLCCLSTPRSPKISFISVYFLPSLLSLATLLCLRLRIRGKPYPLLQLTGVLADQVLLATLRVPSPAYSTPLITQFSDADNVKLSDLGASNLPKSPPTLLASETPHLPSIHALLSVPCHPRFHLLPPPNCLPQYSFLAPSPTTRARTVHVRAVRTEL